MKIFERENKCKIFKKKKVSSKNRCHGQDRDPKQNFKIEPENIYISKYIYFKIYIFLNIYFKR